MNSLILFPPLDPQTQTLYSHVIPKLSVPLAIGLNHMVIGALTGPLRMKEVVRHTRQRWASMSSCVNALQLSAAMIDSFMRQIFLLIIGHTGSASLQTSCTDKTQQAMQVFQYYHNGNSYRAIDVLSGVSTILCGPFVALRHSAFKVSNPATSQFSQQLKIHSLLEAVFAIWFAFMRCHHALSGSRVVSMGHESILEVYLVQIWITYL